jgi:putative redox protein
VERRIELLGELTEEQRTRLLEIADRCPVHRTLTSEVSIRTRLAPGPTPAP